MFFKILQILQFICSLVHEAEGLFPAGAGLEKKASVMKSLTSELRKEGMLGSDDDRASQELLAGFGGVVDGLVKSANAGGAFRFRPAIAPVSEPPPPPPPLPDP